MGGGGTITDSLSKINQTLTEHKINHLDGPIEIWSGTAKSGDVITYNINLSTLGWRNLYIVFYEPLYNARQVVTLPKLMHRVVSNLYYPMRFLGDSGIVDEILDIIPGQDIADDCMQLRWTLTYDISIVSVFVD